MQVLTRHFLVSLAVNIVGQCGKQSEMVDCTWWSMANGKWGMERRILTSETLFSCVPLTQLPADLCALIKQESTRWILNDGLTTINSKHGKKIFLLNGDLCVRSFVYHFDHKLPKIRNRIVLSNKATNYNWTPHTMVKLQANRPKPVHPKL